MSKLSTLVLLAGFAAGSAWAKDITFRKITLTPHFWAEGAAAGDFNRDGRQDVVYGPFWWAGPEFTQRHEYRTPTATSFKRKQSDGSEEQVPGYEGALGSNNAYSDNFFTWTGDFNHDGWIDILLIGLPGEPTWWFENPRGTAGLWTRHVVLDVTDNESPMFTQFVGDPAPELVCNSKGFFGYAVHDPAHPERPWTFHPVTPNKNYHKYNHGVGVGDVNGDGRLDLLEKDGWWEQPASLEGDPVWKHHPFTFCPPPPEAGVPVGGAQMYAYDVNGDGRNDVITAYAAHGYRLAWFEQTRDGAAISFQPHLVIGKTPQENRHGVAFSQVHAIDLVDMDGDGLKDLITGKRFWAHGPQGDPEPNAPAVLYWFRLVRGPGNTAEYIPHLIDNNSGVGTQVMAVDVSGDRRPDVVVGNKKGGYVFVQEDAKGPR
ncbi:MAG TPA: VCBS repeat-containing protein [Verrucomicrobiota bacterium]|nr:VCBS repeat-containing protein [Verrucomicrobiota bacterium]HNU52015.1 VCBS repeat-containing protein [Verrucomicrobiota bacterium]